MLHFSPYGLDDDFIKNYLDDDVIKDYFDDDRVQAALDDDGTGTLFSGGTLFCASVAVVVAVGSSSLW